MKIDDSIHLTYCTNIHPGESWSEVFDTLKLHVPKLKGSEPFGLGLRLSGVAAAELVASPELISDFNRWLQEENVYVFTMNGFPYGQFHDTAVKDDVHKPDWLTDERVTYTINLATILAELTAPGQEAGISTSPLSYRHWHEDIDAVIRETIPGLVEVVIHLNKIYLEENKLIHIDIEPEPDGVLENISEFIRFYKEFLLPLGGDLLRSHGIENTEEVLRRHIQLCHDICHFSVEFESPAEVISLIRTQNIPVGKIQVSAALASDAPREKGYDALSAFNESTYLHQAVGRKGGALEKFKDLPPLLELRPDLDEVRCHFHVPIFTQNFEALNSTQADIVETLRLCKAEPFTQHLEVETYTWNVLPEKLETGLTESIARELMWVKETWENL